jgi:hypothetical protein
MKKRTYFLLCIIFCSISINAQGKKEPRSKIKILKIAYITEQLNLTEKEAEKFWPVYNGYRKKERLLRNELRTRIRSQINEAGKIDSLTEKNAEILVLLKLNIDKKLVASSTDFLAKVKTVISYKKILKLQIAEMEFGRKLMQKYKRGKR